MSKPKEVATCPSCGMDFPERNAAKEPVYECTECGKEGYDCCVPGSNSRCEECEADAMTDAGEKLRERQLKDAAMLLRMAIMKLRRGNGSQRCFALKIGDWLQRNGLQGSILRVTNGDSLEEQ